MFLREVSVGENTTGGTLRTCDKPVLGEAAEVHHLLMDEECFDALVAMILRIKLSVGVIDTYGMRVVLNRHSPWETCPVFFEKRVPEAGGLAGGMGSEVGLDIGMQEFGVALRKWKGWMFVSGRRKCAEGDRIHLRPGHVQYNSAGRKMAVGGGHKFTATMHRSPITIPADWRAQARERKSRVMANVEKRREAGIASAEKSPIRKQVGGEKAKHLMYANATCWRERGGIRGRPVSGQEDDIEEGMHRGTHCRRWAAQDGTGGVNTDERDGREHQVAWERIPTYRMYQGCIRARPGLSFTFANKNTPASPTPTPSAHPTASTTYAGHPSDDPDRPTCELPYHPEPGVNCDSHDQTSGCKFYVVAPGHVVGAYTDANRVMDQVICVHKAYQESFKTWKDATAYWATICRRNHGKFCPNAPQPHHAGMTPKTRVQLTQRTPGEYWACKGIAKMYETGAAAFATGMRAGLKDVHVVASTDMERLELFALSV
ncbi:hypothetical protein FB451DRAFT_1171987 [Mycena latifolia]|nr:hypothetical protein FB451DRAFT_1171987 [Mycena latifolia]